MRFDLREIATITTVLFAVIDVVGAVPVILELRKRDPASFKPISITWVSGLIMIVFLFVGQTLLNLIGIDVQSFAIAGSFILFVIAVEMLLGIRIYKDDTTANSNIVPIAFPLIAGAGTLTTLLSLRAQYAVENILVGVLANVVFVYLVLRNLYRIENLLGPGGINILRKVFGVVLLALAVKLFKTNI
jgi:multiple antibiotic resistance protein